MPAFPAETGLCGQERPTKFTLLHRRWLPRTLSCKDRQEAGVPFRLARSRRPDLAADISSYRRQGAAYLTQPRLLAGATSPIDCILQRTARPPGSKRDACPGAVGIEDHFLRSRTRTMIELLSCSDPSPDCLFCSGSTSRIPLLIPVVQWSTVVARNPGRQSGEASVCEPADGLECCDWIRWAL
jgi:hypothetical protein